MKKGAIITADIVNFTTLDAAKQRRLLSSIKLILKEAKTEFYRGDSFQVYIADPAEALRILLKLRATAKTISETAQSDLRACIGLGEVKIPIRELKTNISEAFVLSGRGFEHLKKNELLKIESANTQTNTSFRLISYFADYIFTHLTAKQAAVLIELLNGKTQVEIGKKLKKSQSTIQKHVTGASWIQIDMLLNEYTPLIEQLNEL